MAVAIGCPRKKTYALDSLLARPRGLLMAVENKEKSLLVSKKAFDEVLTRLLSSKPLPKSKIRTRGKRGPKTPIFQKT